MRFTATLERLTLLCLAAVCACATPQVAAPRELALKRVAIYRNGVAYFERSGRIRADRLQFKVRPEHVGDFLATLAVMEKGGSSVRAASFPLQVEEVEGEEAAEGAQPRSSRALQSVILELDGEAHDLAVGYVTEQPVWKPSYRVVLGEGGPTLQAWGIVQNVSGEDWKDVQLSLVAGAPISFEATLQRPVVPSRPTLNDTGEMISAVPRSQSTLAQRPPAPVAPPPPPAPRAAPNARESRNPSKREAGPPSAMPQAPAAPSPEPSYSMEDAAPRNLSMLAAQTVEGGATQYDLPHTVTVPNDSATMVLLLVQKVEGEAVFMFAPEGGVPDSSRHPFRVVRFKNPTKGLLERGPIAVYGEDAFLGQGLMEPLSAGGEATIPFALDRGLAVDSDRQYSSAGARLARIEHGQLQLERDQIAKTSYRVRSGKPDAVRVVLRHPRTQGMKLHRPPDGSRDQVGEATALIPLQVPGHETATLVVEERRAYPTHADWFSPEADEAVRRYLADPRAAPAVAEALRGAWALRGEIVKAREEREKLQGEQDILAAASEETRENLRALAKNKSGVDSLRQTLARRLKELDERLAKLSHRLVELDLELNEKGVRFTERLREVKLTEALREAP